MALVERKASVFAAVASAACFGTLAIFAKLAYANGAEPLELLVSRFTLATLLLGGLLLVTKPASLKAGKRDLLRFAALSFMGYGAASLCFFFGLRSTSASVMAILLYTYPVMVTLVEPLLGGPSLTRLRLLAVAIAFLGCVFVADPFSAAATVGIPGLLLGLGAGAGYASFSLLSARLLPERSRLSIMVWMFAFTALLIFVAALLSGAPLTIYDWSATGWLLLLGIVAVPTVASILLYFAAIKGLGAGQAALLSTSEPLFTIFFAALLLGDRLTPVQWGGTLLVLAGVVLAEASARRRPAIAAV